MGEVLKPLQPQTLVQLLEQDGTEVRLVALPGKAPEVVCTRSRAFICAGLFDPTIGAWLYRPASCCLLYKIGG